MPWPRWRGGSLELWPPPRSYRPGVDATLCRRLAARPGTPLVAVKCLFPSTYLSCNGGGVVGESVLDGPCGQARRILAMPSRNRIVMDWRASAPRTILLYCQDPLFQRGALNHS